MFRRYNDMVFERFWKRDLDIEDIAVIATALTKPVPTVQGFLCSVRIP